MSLVQEMAKPRALFFQALANVNRVRILEALLEGPLSVGEIARKLGMDQTLVSHSLKCLTFCGFVGFRREGRRTIYWASQAVNGLFRLADRHIAKHAPRLYTCETLER